MAAHAFDAKAPARTLVACSSSNEDSYLVGTSELRSVNEIKLLTYSDDDDQLKCSARYSHKYEVNSLAAHPTNSRLIATCFNTVATHAACVWKLPQVTTDRNSSSAVDVPLNDLQAAAEVPRKPSGHTKVAWVGADGLVAAGRSDLSYCQLREDGTINTTKEIPIADRSFVGDLVADPHHPNEVVLAVDNALESWDLRSGDRSHSIDQAVQPGLCVRTVSYNPNKPWCIATGGDDFHVKCWDLRKTTAPLSVLSGHSHWVSAVAYNPFHDQLIVSGGTDARVNLWRVSSISSAPLVELGDEDLPSDAVGEGGTSRKSEAKLAADAAVRTHEDHEDSVYAVCWSAQNAWTYASLSHTGKVVINTVPSAEKYKILL